MTMTEGTLLSEILHYGAPLNLPASTPSLPFSAETLEIADERRKRPVDDHSKLLKEGVQLWCDVCRRTAERAASPLLLPLSAGLDSRAVLAGLRANDISVQTVTYGVPGAFDYELAPRIADCAGASNERIDLQTIEITRDRLIAVAATAPRPSSILDMFFNQLIPAQYGRSFSYINGFVGDALAGNNLKTAEGFHWPEATRAFAKWHQASRTVRLTHSEMDPIAALPDAPLVDPGLLPSIQQLDYAIRQQCMVRPIVCPPNVEVMMPFLDPSWCAFMLGLPEELRRNRAFFVELFQHGFPQLFSLPTTATGGLPLGAKESEIRHYRKRLRRRRRFRTRLHRIFPRMSVPPANRGWQYLDFRSLLREDTPLAQLFADSMARLDERRVAPWIDASGLLRSHRACEADHFKALNVLLNLELLLTTRSDLFEPGSTGES